MRADHTDAALRDRIYALLDTCFPLLSARIRTAERAGAPWHEVSTAFVALAGDDVVAHAGVISLPLCVGGERRTVAGIHAVCTHPAHRGGGHARALLEEALEHVDGRFDSALLTTSIPALYQRFGFRTVPERVFHPAPPPRPERRPEPLRPLRHDDARDLALLYDLLGRRTPVSHRLASVDPGWLFVINEVLGSWGFRRLYHARELDAVIACDVDGDTLRVLDVVAAVLPPLDELLARVTAPFRRLELWFPPDRFVVSGLTTTPSHPSDQLMVRGALSIAGDVMLPPLARC